MLPIFDHYITQLNNHTEQPITWVEQQMNEMKADIQELYDMTNDVDKVDLTRALVILNEYSKRNNQLLKHYNLSYNYSILQQIIECSKVLICAASVVTTLSNPNTQRCVSPINYVGR